MKEFSITGNAIVANHYAPRPSHPLAAQQDQSLGGIKPLEKLSRYSSEHTSVSLILERRKEELTSQDRPLVKNMTSDADTAGAPRLFALQALESDIFERVCVEGSI